MSLTTSFPVVYSSQEFDFEALWFAMENNSVFLSLSFLFSFLPPSLSSCPSHYFPSGFPLGETPQADVFCLKGAIASLFIWRTGTNDVPRFQNDPTAHSNSTLAGPVRNSWGGAPGSWKPGFAIRVPSSTLEFSPGPREAHTSISLHQSPQGWVCAQRTCSAG